MIKGFSVSVVMSLGFLGSIAFASQPKTCLPAVDWVVRGETEAGSFDIAKRVAVDGQGNSYVCGWKLDDHYTPEMRVERLDADGVSIWVDLMDTGEVHYPSAGYGVATDSNGDIVAVGMAQFPHIYGSHGIVRKYSSDGNILWTLTYSGGQANSGCYASGVAVDGERNIYVVGKEMTSSSEYVTSIRKLSSTGEIAWLKYVSGVEYLFDAAVVPNGDLVCVGEGLNAEGKPFPMVVRYTKDGAMVYVSPITMEYGDPNPVPVEVGSAYGVAVDKADDECFYVTGYGTTQDGNRIVLMKFRDKGIPLPLIDPIWHKFYNNGVANGVDVREDGAVVVAGGANSDWAIIQTDSEGVQTCMDITDRELNGPEGDYANDLKCTTDGGIVICGRYKSEYSIQWQTAKLLRQGRNGTGPGTVAVGNPGTPGPDHPGGLKPGDVRVAGGSRGLVDPRRGEGASVSVYPTSAGTVVLTVIDRKGGVVKQVSAPATGSGTVTLTWDGKNASGAPVAPGIYAVRVEGPGIKQVSKVAVVY